MKGFKKVLNIISRNWTALLYFEILYKIVGFSVVFPFIRYLLDSLPRLAGQNYLSQENVGELFKSPPAIFVSLALMILAALYVSYELTAFMVLCEYGWNRKKLSLVQLCIQSAAKTVKLLRPGNIGVFVMLPVLMLSVFSPVSGYLKTIRIPGFLLEYLLADPLLSVLFSRVLIIFHILLFLYLFGFPLMLFSDKSFVGSWRESLKLLKRRKIRVGVTVVILTGFFLLSLLVLSGSFVLLLGLYARFLVTGRNGRILFEMELVRWLGVFRIAGSTLTSAFVCGTVLFLYHRCRGDEQPEEQAVTKEHIGISRMILRLGSLVLLVCVLLFYCETEIGGAQGVLEGYSPMIIAHRAGAALAPENTLEALRHAIGDGADAAEIDVQQLGDGTLVVLHDPNFKRTTGVDLNVRDGQAVHDSLNGFRPLKAGQGAGPCNGDRLYIRNPYIGEI